MLEEHERMSQGPIREKHFVDASHCAKCFIGIISFSPLWNIHSYYQHLTDEEMEQREGTSLCQTHTARKDQSPCEDSGSLTVKAHAPLKPPLFLLSSYKFYHAPPYSMEGRNPREENLESWLQESGELVTVLLYIPYHREGKELTKHQRAPQPDCNLSAQWHHPCKCGPLKVMEPNNPIRGLLLSGRRQGGGEFKW